MGAIRCREAVRQRLFGSRHEPAGRNANEPTCSVVTSELVGETRRVLGAPSRFSYGEGCYGSDVPIRRMRSRLPGVSGVACRDSHTR